MKFIIMKKILLLLFALFFTASFSQENRAIYGEVTTRGTFDEYLSKNGDLLKVGDTLQIGIATGVDRFTYILQGNGNMHPTHSGKKVKITKIFSAGRISSGLKVFINFRGFGLLPVHVDYETAFEVGEIILPNRKMTRDQAIEKLKESKELLDLEVITTEEYEEIRKELIPIILDKKED